MDGRTGVYICSHGLRVRYPAKSSKGDRVLGVPEMIPEIAFNDMGVEEQARWASRMTHTSTALFATPTGFEPWSSGVPCGYIFCSEDRGLPLPIQQQMAAHLGPNSATTSLRSGHCPHLSMPDQLVQAVQLIESKLS